MTLTFTYSANPAVKDALTYIMQKRFCTASFIIRKLITEEASRIRQEEEAQPVQKAI
jgi:hypothetical protein